MSTEEQHLVGSPRLSDVEAMHFESLRALHRMLDAVFTLHQELLVMLELGLAEDVFDAHLLLLRLHMKHEEDWLLPAYRALGAWPRFPEVLYLGQHRKLLAQLQRVRSGLSQYRAAGDASPRAALAILDLETTYKHLSEHHDQAEAQGLFKALDAGMPVSERYWLVQRCSDEFLLASNTALPLLRRARQRVLDRTGG
jgi:hypothetical protein